MRTRPQSAQRSTWPPSAAVRHASIGAHDAALECGRDARHGPGDRHHRGGGTCPPPPGLAPRGSGRRLFSSLSRSNGLGVLPIVVVATCV